MYLLLVLHLFLGKPLSIGSELQQTPKAYFKKAIKLYISERANESITYLKLLHSRFSKSSLSPWAMLVASSLYESLGDYTASRKELSDLIDEYPDFEFIEVVKRHKVELDLGFKYGNSIIIKKFYEIYESRNNSLFWITQARDFIKTFPKFILNIKLELQVVKYLIENKQIRSKKIENFLFSALSQSLKPESMHYKTEEIINLAYNYFILIGNYSALNKFSEKLKKSEFTKKSAEFLSASTIIKYTMYLNYIIILFFMLVFLAINYVLSPKSFKYLTLFIVFMFIASFLLKNTFLFIPMLIFSEFIPLINLITYDKFNNKTEIISEGSQNTTNILILVTTFYFLFLPFHLLIVSSYFPWFFIL